MTARESFSLGIGELRFSNLGIDAFRIWEHLLDFTGVDSCLKRSEDSESLDDFALMQRRRFLDFGGGEYSSSPGLPTGLLTALAHRLLDLFGSELCPGFSAEFTVALARLADGSSCFNLLSELLSKSFGVSSISLVFCLHSLHFDRCLPCSHIQDPPHSLHCLLRLPWSQIPEPPHSLQSALAL